MSGVGLSEKIISIHALAKRATRITTCTAYDAVISIHALAKRATTEQDNPLNRGAFQSTPSQRGRLTGLIVAFGGSEFQSTPSQRGRRDEIIPFEPLWAISIHALVKRATIILHQILIFCIISIHALAKRAT